MTHASNVCGTILPVQDAARLAHRHGAVLLVDAAQTAGVLPIDVVEMGIDLLAFPGHKGLLGPTGTGGLYVSPDVRLAPLRQGGTGTRSEEERQPEELPEALEAGTVNTVGIAGLGAALRVLQGLGLARVQAHEAAVATRLLAGLRDIPGVRVHGPATRGARSRSSPSPWTGGAGRSRRGTGQHLRHRGAPRSALRAHRPPHAGNLSARDGAALPGISTTEERSTRRSRRCASWRARSGERAAREAARIAISDDGDGARRAGAGGHG
jgi:hypothetical protein